MTDQLHSRRIPMTEKHLARSVKNGCLVTFRVFDGDDVTGYVAGWDDDAYFVLVPMKRDDGADIFERQLVRKITNPTLVLHDDPTFVDEPCRGEMDSVLNAFRIYVVRNILNPEPPSRARKAG